MLNFKIDDKIKIMIKPIQSNIKSTSAAALSERSVSFETWRHFVIELFKLNQRNVLCLSSTTVLAASIGKLMQETTGSVVYLFIALYIVLGIVNLYWSAKAAGSTDISLLMPVQSSITLALNCVTNTSKNENYGGSYNQGYNVDNGNGYNQGYDMDNGNGYNQGYDRPDGRGNRGR